MRGRSGPAQHRSLQSPCSQDSADAWFRAVPATVAGRKWLFVGLDERLNVNGFKKMDGGACGLQRSEL